MKILSGLILSLFLITPSFAIDNWTPLSPLGTDNAADIDALVQVNNNSLDRILAYGRWGCKLVYSSTSSLTINAGSVVCSNAAGTTRRLRANSSTISTGWTVAENGLDAGAEAGSTTYYIYAVGDADTATFTVRLSTNSVSPTGITYYKRLGSFYNDASSNITNVNDDIYSTLITTTMLKTTTGEVSTSVFNTDLTLPGGEYGFYPQIRGSSGGGVGATITYWPGYAWTFHSTSYVTNILLGMEAGNTAYARQRYITASGEDIWIFLLIDKETDRIVGSYSANDAPWYGNTGDQEKVPHPFLGYNPDTQEVLLVDNDTIDELKLQVTKDRSLLTIINEDYKVDYAQKRNYRPLHSGKYITKEGKYVKEMVTEIAPYIKVKPLKKYTAEEKTQRKIKEEQEKLEYKQNKKEKEDKLEEIRVKLNLTKEDFGLLKENVR